MAAREVAVSAIGTIYAIDDDEGEGGQASIRDNLRARWSLPTALAFLVWFVFAPQCISTIAVTRRETNGWKWPAFMVGYLFALALLSRPGATYWLRGHFRALYERRIMAGSVNKVILIGNLGKDPESRSFQNGGKVVQPADRDHRIVEGQEDRRAQGKDRVAHRRKVFNEGLANVAERFLRKGSKVYIEGELHTRKWQDQQGHDRYSTEVVLQGFDGVLTMLDGAPGAGGGTGGGGGGGGDDWGSSGGGDSFAGQSSRGGGGNFNSGGRRAAARVAATRRRRRL